MMKYRKQIDFPPPIILLLSFCHRKWLMGWLIAMGITVLGIGNVQSQPTIAASNPQSLDLQVTNLEQQYDAHIIQILSNYFDRKKFFVDVNISAEMVDEPFAISQNQVIKDNSRQNLFMPGLPFLPEENLKQPSDLTTTSEKTINQNTVKALRLVKINVNIYADTSLKANELELMRFITRVAIKMNEERGDEISISQLAIPDYSQRPEPITAATISPSSTPSSLYDSLFTYIPGIVLMMLFGLTILFSRLINKQPQVEPNTRQRRSALKEAPSFDIESIPPSPQQEKATTPTVPYSTDEIISAFFKRPEEIAAIFRFWLGEVHNGAQKAAKVIVAVDKQLLRTLKGALHPEDFETLSDAVQEIGELSYEERSAIIAEFDEILRVGARETISTQKREYFSLFKFLDHISEKHILTLLETEPPLSGAFILQYLPDEIAAEYIEKLDKDTAAQIMLNMASLSNMSREEQQQISSELFDKAMDLVESERSEQYGAEYLYPILERLPVSEQKQYIEELKATGSIVGAILEKKFITIDKIPELSDDVIQRSVKPLNTETLLDAIVGLDTAIVDKILAARPKREQKLLRLELENMSNSSLQKTEYAKVLLMNYIRKNVT